MSMGNGMTMQDSHGEAGQSVEPGGSFAVLIAFYTLITFYFFVYQGLGLLLFPFLAKETRIEDIGASRYVRVKGEIFTDIYRSVPGQGIGKFTDRMYAKFFIVDDSGVANVRFAFPGMGTPYNSAEIIGVVIDQGYTTTINAVSVEGMLPWMHLVLMAVCYMAALVISYPAVFFSKR